MKHVNTFPYPSSTDRSEKHMFTTELRAIQKTGLKKTVTILFYCERCERLSIPVWNTIRPLSF